VANSLTTDALGDVIFGWLPMWRRDGRRTALSQQPSPASFQQRHDSRGAA